ncbi:MAG: DegV family protein [Chloroflexi bacterium]|nr:DegV family protein [Chloroflexota bacterium]
MGQVAVVTDSVSCLPKELVKEYCISVVPVDMVFEGQIFRDGVDHLEYFYTLLAQARHLPTTSAPSPGAYLEAFRQASTWADSILCLTASAKVSAMLDSALKAKELAKEEIPQLTINVLDSRSATMTQGFVALAAARTAAKGQGIEEVTRVAEEVCSRAYMLFVLDTLYYLAKGGRVPKAAAWGASFLKIKPILTFSRQGEVELLERARTKPKAVARLLNLMRQRLLAGEPLHVAVMHANVPEEAERLRAEVASQFYCAELYVTEFTPVMGAHTGPGMVGLAFYSGA